MGLELSVSDPRGATVRKFRVSEAGGWIGRGRNCEVIIDDPDRFVSLQHARIDYASGQFWLTDQSTNGTFLNDAAAPLVRGERQPLHDGDRLRIGLFDIRIALRTSGGVHDAEAGPAVAGSVVREGPGPLLEFDRGPGGAVSALSNTGRREPDPLAVLIADLTKRPSGARIPEKTMASADGVAQPVGTASRVAEMAARAPISRDTPDRIEAPKAKVEPAPAESRSMGMLGMITAEVAHLSPALREPAAVAEPVQPERESDPAPRKALPTVQPPRPVDPATAAVAAFWCGLGIIPRQLHANDLIDVMAELGMAFREAAEGFSALLGSGQSANLADRNPFGNGHGGLRRHFEARDPGAMRLDEAVREVFARNEQRNRAYREAVREGIARMAESLTPSAVERKFAGAARGRFRRSRHAELWRMYCALESELGRFAQAEFQADVERHLQADDAASGKASRERLVS